MAKLLVKIAKAIAAMAKTGYHRAKMGVRGGIRYAGNFSRAALSSIFGGGGRMPQPEPEEIDPVPDMSGLDEALAQLNADIDDENEEEFKAQHRALTEGMEPKDIYEYSKADSVEKREEIALKMRRSTREWVKGLTDDQNSRIAKAGEDGVRFHVMGIRPISGVPQFPKNDLKNVAEFKAPKPMEFNRKNLQALGIDLDAAMQVAEAAANDPLPKATPAVAMSARKPVKGKAADEPELELQSAPGLARAR